MFYWNIFACWQLFSCCCISWNSLPHRSCNHSEGHNKTCVVKVLRWSFVPLRCVTETGTRVLRLSDHLFSYWVIIAWLACVNTSIMCIFVRMYEIRDVAEVEETRPAPWALSRSRVCGCYKNVLSPGLCEGYGSGAASKTFFFFAQNFTQTTLPNVSVLSKATWSGAFFAWLWESAVDLIFSGLNKLEMGRSSIHTAKIPCFHNAEIPERASGSPKHVAILLALVEVSNKLTTKYLCESEQTCRATKQCASSNWEFWTVLQLNWARFMWQQCLMFEKHLTQSCVESNGWSYLALIQGFLCAS